ncbi:ICEBs1 excisionase [Lachnospiraceae bacterium C1.1]|nr:helix-turn-helix domain-containing protein [Lachnospiraceae bacterium]MDN4744592.1 ICEBs1 excisionase [Lachnospiraceae bacterium C1.1]
MEGKLYYTADEVAQMVGVGRTKAYGIVKQMNQELKERGYLTVGGKIPKEFFDSKYFGGSGHKEVSA